MKIETEMNPKLPEEVERERLKVSRARMFILRLKTREGLLEVTQALADRAGGLHK